MCSPAGTIKVWPRLSESEVIAGVDMKLLGVFLLAVLGCGLAEGAIVAKCDLRNQLLSAVGSLSVTGRHTALSGIDLVARCK